VCVNIIFVAVISARREYCVFWKRDLRSFGGFVTFWSAEGVSCYLLLVDRGGSVIREGGEINLVCLFEEG